ncbi:MAG: DUF349 domain-containing protein [Bacteroidales bacterium]|nr:DUF349 domain-containing protein [Bacteroidales bacterium]
MESQDPISIQNQEPASDNAKIETPATSNGTEAQEPKVSAADLILQKLQALNQEPLEKIVQEVSKENLAPATADDQSDSDDNEPEQSMPAKDYSELSKEELVAAMQELVSRDNILECRNDVEAVKNLFYKCHRAELALKRQKFVEDGNNEADFRAEADPLEEKFKSFYDQYREKRNKNTEEIEKMKLDNLEKKKQIIAKIEALINSQETLNQTFDEFKNLQKQWRDIGVVPQTEVKKLWDSYNFQVVRFYDFVKINKELRDLELKKNTEQKLALCERAEELLIETKVVRAFNELQKLHEQWREIGPAFAAQNEELWERFKKATNIINKNHQDYYANIKKEQESNYKAKMLICDKTEEIVAPDYTSHKEWEAKSKEILELQKMWKLIGFAPKKYNNAVYERFRNACDKFFEKKRYFYAQYKEEADNNLQMKEDLCVQAEGLKDSTDWKKTTEILKNLQAKWKTIGAVPRKNSEEIWQRFRSACNAFFDNKQKHFQSIDKEQDANLKLKEELIAEVENFKFGDNDEKNISSLKELQKRWTAIGQVPRSKKDSIYDRFRKAIDSQFAKINIDEAKRNEVKVKNLIESTKNSPQAYEKLRAERERIKNRQETLRQQIILSENNLGFFAKSKNADNMIEGFRKKMEKSKNEVEALQKLVAMLNKAISELPKKGDKK